MSRVGIVCWLVGLTACSAGIAPPAHPTTRPTTEAVVAHLEAPSAPTQATPSNVARAPRVVVAAPPESEAPSVVLPAGIACAVHGSGAPFGDGCTRRLLGVRDARAGGTALARFETSSIDVTWGFFETPGRAWVLSRSGGVRLEGFADASTEQFGLTREIAAVEAHVWFAFDAPVRVLGGKHRGLRVAVTGDLPGVDGIVAETSCESVHYDPAPVRRPPDAAPAVAGEPVRFAVPVGKTLPIRYAPGGPVRAILGDAKTPLDMSLGVLESHLGYSRVTFETAHARFDVWVDDRQLVDGGFGIGGTGFGACGGIADYGRVDLFEITDDTPVLVGPLPIDGPKGVTLERGARVFVDARSRGFARVSPFSSSIVPPEGSYFWVPEAALTHA